VFFVEATIKQAFSNGLLDIVNKATAMLPQEFFVVLVAAQGLVNGF